MLITFARLIRWPNVLIVAVLQCLVFFNLLDWQSSVMTLPAFLLLVFVTICITAAGNVINDYYDRETDKINRPGTTIVGVSWSANQVLTIYKVILLAGAVAAMCFALVHHLLLYLPVYVLAIAGLHLYSSHLKCKPLIGNVWVALYCGAVVLIVAIPDMLLGNEVIVNQAIWYYILFAMITTLHREITKDLEDQGGDQAVNCNTLVVTYGTKTGKIASVVAVAIAIICIYAWDRVQVSNTVKIVLLALQGGLIGSIALIWWAKDASYYAKASTVIKFVMIGGTLLLLLKPLHA